MSHAMISTERVAESGVGGPLATRAQAAQLRLIAATDPDWDGWLGLTYHDVYHTAAYHRLAEQHREGRAFLAVFGSSDHFLAWPYLLRDISLTGRHAGRTDVTSVYGYAGPLARGVAGNPRFIHRAWGAVHAAWLRQGAVSAFTRFHPLLANQRLLADSRCVVEIGPTVSIDLTIPDEAAIRLYPRVLRQEIAAARRRGLQTERDPNWERLSDFVSLYDLSMRQVGATGGYFYSAEYFRRLRDELADRAHLFVTCLADRVVAAGVFFEHDGMLHAHLVGTDPELRAISPLKVLLDDVRAWGHRRGSRLLHLGGGRGGQADTLLEFKGRFSPQRHPFSMGRWILDQRVYRQMSAERRQTALRAGTAWDPRFFPAYRA